MVLEGLAFALLNSYLGGYVELDQSQLKIGLWSGRLELRSLAIKPSSLARAGLPLELARGNIGLFEVQANWLKLKSQPVRITVHDIFMLLRPRSTAKKLNTTINGNSNSNGNGNDMSDDDDNDELEERHLMEFVEAQKQAILDTAVRRAARTGLQSSSDTSSENVETLGSAIMDNISVNIERIHVCIDAPSIPRPFTCGFVLHSLSLTTVDHHGNPAFSSGGDVNRRLHMRGAAVYWNTVASNHQYNTERAFRDSLSLPFHPSSSATSSSSAAASSSSSSGNDNGSNGIDIGSFQYLVTPANMECHIRQRKTGAATLPRVSATIEIGHVGGGISSLQFSTAAAYGVDVATFASRLRHAPYCPPYQRPHPSHPRVTVKWWRYVMAVIGQRVRDRRLEWSVAHMRDSLRDYRFYTSLHQQRMRALRAAARSPGATPVMSPEVMTGLARIERKVRHVSLLLAWRQAADDDTRLTDALATLAHTRRERGDDIGNDDDNEGDDMLDVPVSPPAAAAAVSSRTSWFSALFGSPTSSSSSTTPTSASEGAPTLSLRDLRDDGKRNDVRDNDKRSIIDQLGYCPWSESRWLTYATERALAAANDVDEPTRADLRLQLAAASFQLCDDHTITTPAVTAATTTTASSSTITSTRIPFVTAAIAQFGVNLKFRDDSAKMDVQLAQLIINDALARSHFRSLICPMEMLQHSSLPSSATGVTAATTTTTITKTVKETKGLPAISPHARAGSIFSFDSPTNGSNGSAANGHDTTDGSSPLFRASLTYFFAPADHQPHMKVTAKSGSLAIVFNPLCYDRIQRFIMIQQITDTIIWEELQVSAFNAFTDLKERVESKLDYILNNHIRMQCDINLQAPTIIIPHSSPTDTGSFIAIRLGQLTVTSATPPIESTSTRSSMILPSSAATTSASLSASSSTSSLGSLSPIGMVSRRSLLSNIDENGTVTSPQSEPPSSPPIIESEALLLPTAPLSARVTSSRSEKQVSFLASPLSESKDHDSFTSSPAAATNGNNRRGSTRQPLHIRVPSALALSSPSHSSSSEKLNGNHSNGNGHLPRDSISSDKLSRLLYDVFLIRVSDVAVQLVPVTCLFQWMTPSSPTTITPSARVPSRDPVVHIVQGITAEVSISISVLPSDTSVTRAKIVGRLSPLTATLSSSQYARIVDIAAHLQASLPPSASPPMESKRSSSSNNTSTASSSLDDTFSILEPPSPSSSSLSLMSPVRPAKPKTPAITTTTPAAEEAPGDWIMLECQLEAPCLAVELVTDRPILSSMASPSSSQDSKRSNASSSNGGTTTLVRAAIEGLHVSLTQRPYDICTRFQLHSVSIEDCLHRHQPHFAYLLSSASTAVDTTASPPTDARTINPSSPSSSIGSLNGDHDDEDANHLITATAQLMTDTRRSPLNGTAEAACQVDCAFNALRVNWNPGTLKALIHAFTPAPSVVSTPAAAAVPLSSVSQSMILPSSSASASTSASTMLSTSYAAINTPMRPLSTSIHNGTPHPSVGINARASTPAISRLLAMSSKAVRSAAPATLSSFTPMPSQQPRSAIDFVRRILRKIGIDSAPVTSSTIEGTPMVARKLDVSSPSPIFASASAAASSSVVLTPLPQLRVTTKLGLFAASLNREDVGVSLTQIEIADIQVTATLGSAGTQVTGHLGMFTIFDARSATAVPPVPSTSNGSPTTTAAATNGSSLPLVPPVWSYRQQLFWTRSESGRPLLYISFTDRQPFGSATTTPSSSSTPTSNGATSTSTPSASSTDGYDSRLEVRLSSIQCIVLPNWCADMYDYVREGVMHDAATVASAQAKAAIASYQQEPSFDVRSFSITIDHPLLVLPHNFPTWCIDPARIRSNGSSSSNGSGMGKARLGYFDWVAIDLGRISLANEFYATPIAHDITLPNGWNGRFATGSTATTNTSVRSIVPMQRISIRMSSLNVETVHTLIAPSWVIRPRPVVPLSTVPVGEKIFADTDIDCHIETPLGGLTITQIPEAKVDVDVRTVRLIVSVDELAFLMIGYRTDVAPLLARYAKAASTTRTTSSSAAIASPPAAPLPSVIDTDTKRSSGSNGNSGSMSRIGSTPTLISEPLWSPLPPDTPLSPSVISTSATSWRITPTNNTTNGGIMGATGTSLAASLMLDDDDDTTIADGKDSGKLVGPWLSRVSLRLHKLVLGLNMTRTLPLSLSSPSPRIAELIVGPLVILADVRPDHTFVASFKMDSISLLDARAEVKEPSLRRIIAGHKETVSDSSGDDTLSQSDNDDDDTDSDSDRHAAIPMASSSSLYDSKRSSNGTPPLHPHTTPMRTDRTRPLNTTPNSTTRASTPMSTNTTLNHGGPTQTLLPDLRIEVSRQGVTTIPSSMHMSCDITFGNPRLLLTAGFLSTMLRFTERLTSLLPTPPTPVSPPASVSPPSTTPSFASSQSWPWSNGQGSASVSLSLTDAQIWIAGEPEVSTLAAASSSSSSVLSSSNVLRSLVRSPVVGGRTIASSSSSFSSSSSTPLSHTSVGASTNNLGGSVAPTSSTFSCLVLRLDLLAAGRANNDGTISGTVQLSNTQAFVCYHASHLRLRQLSPPPSPLMEPWLITITYTGQPPSGPLLGDQHAHHAVDVKASSLESCFSFMQIATAAEVVQSMITTIVAALPSSSSSAVPSSEPLSPVPGTAITAASFPASFTILGEFQGGHLSIVNDAPGYYLPLLSCSVAPWHVRAGSPSRTPWLTLPDCELGRLASDWFFTQLTIDARYYNETISRWEPVIEKWTFGMASDLTTARIWSHDVLDINVTESCIHTISHGIQSFTEQFLTPAPSATPSTPSSASATSSPLTPSSSSRMLQSQARATGKAKGSFFRIRNETGARIRFWLVGPDLTASSLPIEGGAINSDSKRSDSDVSSMEGLPRIDSSMTMSLSSPLPTNASKRHHRSIELEAGDEIALNLPQYQGADADAAAHLTSIGSLRQVEYRSPVIGTRLFVTPKMLAGVDDRIAITPGWRALRSVAKIDIGALDRAANNSNNHRDYDSSSIPPVSVFALHRNNNDGEGKKSLWHDRKYAPQPSLPTTTTSESSSTLVTDHQISCRVLPLPDSTSGKVVVLSSCMSVWNRTAVSLDIRLRHTSTQADATFYRATVKPGARVSLPVLLVSASRVSLGVRPSSRTVNGVTWRWSSYDGTDGIRVSSLGQHLRSTAASTASSTSGGGGTGALLHCVPTDDDTNKTISLPYLTMRDGVESDTAPAFASPRRIPSFTVRMTTIESNSLSIGRNANQHHQHHGNHSGAGHGSTGVGHGSSFYTFVIDPPVILRNTLGIPVEYQVRLKQKPSRLADTKCQLSDLLTHAVYTGRLHHHQEVHWHDVDVRAIQTSLMQIQLRLPPSSLSSVSSSVVSIKNDTHMWSHDWSVAAVLCSTLPSLPKNSHVYVADLIGLQLPVQLYRHDHYHSGAGRIDLSVHCWLLNRSGLPLLYATRPGAALDCMAAGQSVDQCQRAMTQWMADQSGRIPITPTAAEAAASSSSSAMLSPMASLLTNDQLGWNAIPAHVTAQDVLPLSYAPPELKYEMEAMARVRNGVVSRAVCIRLPNTSWSIPLCIDFPVDDGTVTLLELPTTRSVAAEMITANKESNNSSPSSLSSDMNHELPRRLFELAYTVARISPSHPTMTLVLRPRYLLFNATGLPLSYRQCGTNMKSLLLPGHQRPLHRYDHRYENRISLRFRASGWQWAADQYGIGVSSTGNYSVRMYNAELHQSMVLHVRCQLHGASYHIAILPAHSPLYHTPLSMEAANSNSGGDEVGDDADEAVAKPLATIIEDETKEILRRSRTMSIAALEDPTALTEAEPYRLENNSSEMIIFYQDGEPSLGQRLHVSQSYPFAWDEPCATDKRLVLACVARTPLSPSHNGTAHSIPGLVDHDGRPLLLTILGKYNLDSLETHEASVWTDDSDVRKRLVISVIADGRVRVVRIHDYEDDTQLTIAPSSSVISPPAATAEAAGFGVTLNLNGVGISVVMTCGARGSPSYRRPEELLYISAKDLTISARRTGHLVGMDLRLGRFQVDNQLHATPFPVMIRGDPYTLRAACLGDEANTNLNNTSASSLDGGVAMNDDSVSIQPNAAGERKARRVQVTSFLGHSFMRVQLNGDMEGSRDGFYNISLLQIALQRTELNFEEVALTHLYHFGRGLAAHAIQKPTASLLSPTTPHHGHHTASHGHIWSPLLAMGAPIGRPSFMLDREPIFYFHRFTIEPVSLAVSYAGHTGYHGRRSGGATPGRASSSSLPFLWWLARLGISLMSTEDVRLSLSSFDARDLFGSGGVLHETLMTHFTSGWLRLLPQLLASADMIGNPMFLFNAMGRGVKDFVQAPIKGLQTGTPYGMLSAIGEGSQSLLQHTLYGCANTLARVFQSTAKVLTQVGRSSASLSSSTTSSDDGTPLTIRSGITAGALTLVKESKRGLRGAVHGAIALAALPVAGLCNTASSAADTLRQAADPRFPAYRVRHPRLLDGGRLRPYDRVPYALLSFMSDYFIDHHDEYFLHFTIVPQPSVDTPPTTDTDTKATKPSPSPPSSSSSSVPSTATDFTMIAITTRNLLLVDGASQTLLQSIPLQCIIIVQPPSVNSVMARLGYTSSTSDDISHITGDTNNLLWLSLPLSTLFCAQLRRVCAY